MKQLEKHLRIRVLGFISASKSKIKNMTLHFLPELSKLSIHYIFTPLSPVSIMYMVWLILQCKNVFYFKNGSICGWYPGSPKLLVLYLEINVKARKHYCMVIFDWQASGREVFEFQPDLAGEDDAEAGEIEWVWRHRWGRYDRSNGDVTFRLDTSAKKRKRATEWKWKEFPKTCSFPRRWTLQGHKPPLKGLNLPAKVCCCFKTDIGRISQVDFDVNGEIQNFEAISFMLFYSSWWFRL